MAGVKSYQECPLADRLVEARFTIRNSNNRLHRRNRNPNYHHILSNRHYHLSPDLILNLQRRPVPPNFDSAQAPAWLLYNINH